MYDNEAILNLEFSGKKMIKESTSYATNFRKKEDFWVQGKVQKRANMA